MDVRLGTEATPALVGELGPDGVLVATGAVPSRTGFSSVNPLVDTLPGVEQDNVLTGWDVLLESDPSAGAWSSSTTTAPGRSPASARCSSTAAARSSWSAAGTRSSRPR